MIQSVQCAVIGGIFATCSLVAILRKKIGEPRKEIGNPNGFEYRYLNDLKVQYFKCLFSIIHKGYVHGHNSLQTDSSHQGQG